MADMLQFDLVSPEREIASVQTARVEAPGVGGIFGVLPNHAPFMAVLSPGVVCYDAEGKTEQIFVRGGFAEVTPAGLTILAEEAIPVSELNAAEIAQRIKNAEEDLADDDTSPQTRINAQRELDHLKEIQAAL